MQITSYFIGIELRSEPFVPLFVRLQSYVKKNRLDDAVLLQNVLSLHISLYYFDTSLTEQQKKSLKEDVTHFPLTNTISPVQVCYFQNNNKDILCYLSCSQREVLKNLHDFFAKKYPYPNVLENQYNYVPHISLFTILDSEKYAVHKKAVSQIITEEVSKIKEQALTNRLALFQVNSSFSPEIQIPLS